MPFEKSVKGEETENVLANSMMVIMVRGVFTKLSFPYAQCALQENHYFLDYFGKLCVALRGWGWRYKNLLLVNIPHACKLHLMVLLSIDTWSNFITLDKIARSQHLCCWQKGLIFHFGPSTSDQDSKELLGFKVPLLWVKIVMKCDDEIHVFYRKMDKIYLGSTSLTSMRRTKARPQELPWHTSSSLSIFTCHLLPICMLTSWHRHPFLQW